MIKLIASDIDGTLVQDGGNELNPELIEVILALREKGIQFAAATGRQWLSIERIFEPIKKKIFYLSDNGAYVGCCGRNLFLHPLERSLANELIRDIRKIDGLELMISGPDVTYLETKDEELVKWIVEGYRYQIVRVDDLTEIQDDIIKIAAYRDRRIQEYTRPIQEKYADRAKITISGEMWMDCMALGVNKGEAIRLLQESLDIKPEETMAFGDQLNDIEMLGRAYYSFAIGNARDEVKKAARFQADTNVNDGVLKVLKQLL